MGTRADFYIGGKPALEWLGSIGWDGYPDGIDEAVLKAEDEAAFRVATAAFAATREDWTAPDMGWPWPWEDSDTTDYAYVFVPGIGVVHREGDDYVRSAADDEEPKPLTGVAYEYPDMSARQAVTLGPRSGLIVVGSH